MMRDLWNALPDNRPITAICVVEEASFCPPGYQVVSKTYDQDTDADLWKDGFFGRKITRYLCISKTEGQLDYIVEDVCIINERDSPPDGYTLLSHTQDTDQRAMRKKQFCYKLSQKDKTSQAVTDIIVLSKSKKAPQGFVLAGEMNSLVICYKLGPVNAAVSNAQPVNQTPVPLLPYSSSPLTSPPTGPPPPVPPHSSYPSNPYAVPPTRPLYPLNQLQQTGTLGPAANHLPGGMTWPRPPNRPLPPPPIPPLPYSPSPVSQPRSNSSTLSTSSISNYGLDGIPFELNPKYKDLQLLQEFSLPNLVMKSASEIENQFAYDFCTEEQAQQRIPQDFQ